MRGELVLSWCASVDGARNGRHCRAQIPQSRGGIEDRATCGDHVFDEQYLPSGRVATLRKPHGPVGLGFLSDKQRRDAGETAQDRHQRDSTKLETTKHVGARWDERNHAVNDPAYQDRVGLEQILVEVLVRHRARPDDEVPAQTASSIDDLGQLEEFGIRHPRIVSDGSHRRMCDGGPATNREEPMSQPSPGTESETLLAHLNAQREHVLGILEGLDEEALRRPVLPSGWSCLGLLRHLALDDERFWFRGIVAGEQTVIDAVAEGPDDAWQVGPDVPVEAVFDLYRQQIGLTNAIITATPLDAAPAWWPEALFGGWRLDNLREVILHVLTETAVHAGHLDAARELIDGRTWLVLTE